MMNLRINSLRMFVDLAESGSFSATASRHGVSQSAVSQQIGGLEQQFATQLVERSRRRFRLTPAGEAVFQTAREMLQAMERLKLRIMELDKNIGGELQVVTMCNTGVEWLLILIQELEKQQSHIRLKPAYQKASQIYADILGNVADFAVMTSPREDARFEIVTIAEEKFSFVAAAKSSPGGNLSEIAPFIIYAPDSVTAQTMTQAAQNFGRPLTPGLRFEHPDTVIKAIQAVGGFSCLPEASVREALANQDLVEIQSEHPAPVRKIAAVFHRERMQQPLIRAMHEFTQSFSRRARNHVPGSAPAL